MRAINYRLHLKIQVPKEGKKKVHTTALGALHFKI
jgi:hypothetical protein